jgi:hypothetical protein
MEPLSQRRQVNLTDQTLHEEPDVVPPMLIRVQLYRRDELSGDLSVSPEACRNQPKL